MIKLFNASTNDPIGTISEADLQILIDALEEESTDDQDYYIDGATVDLLEQGGATPQLLSLLRSAVGSSEGVEVRWEKG
jgi:hypothetical protein